MATDRQLYEKLGKLLQAAEKQAEGKDGDYRNWCYGLIWDRFWQINKQIKTSPGDYYDPDTSYEEDMKAIYNAYTERLWLMDAMDEVANDENGDIVENEE